MRSTIPPAGLMRFRGLAPGSQSLEAATRSVPVAALSPAYGVASTVPVTYGVAGATGSGDVIQWSHAATSEGTDNEAFTAPMLPVERPLGYRGAPAWRRQTLPRGEGIVPILPAAPRR